MEAYKPSSTLLSTSLKLTNFT